MDNGGTLGKRERERERGRRKKGGEEEREEREKESETEYTRALICLRGHKSRACIAGYFAYETFINGDTNTRQSDLRADA